MATGALLFIALAGWQSRAEAQGEGLERVFPHLTTWDLDGVIGVGHAFGGGTIGLARGRAGVLFVREPRFWALGLTGESVFGRPFALGIEGGVVDDASGLWTQLGASRAVVEDAWSGHAAAGWALFGLELRGETGARAGWQIVGELRVPVGILVHMLRRR